MEIVSAGWPWIGSPIARIACDAVLDNFMHAEPGDAAANFHTLAGAVRLYDATLALWHKLQPRLSLPVSELRREDVATAPKTALAETCRFLGIAWDPALLDASLADAPASAAVRSPAFAARRIVPHWQRYRTPLQPFLRTLGEHAQRLGYDMAAPHD